MKKTLILTFAALVLPVFVQAATITITPSSATVAAGQKITLTVSVDPVGKTISAVKTYISYPADLLTADLFTFGGSWVPVTQGGYDQMNGGILIKTAGYPGGLTSIASFGTITFTAKAAGTATVAVDAANSIAYDANTVNVLSGAQGIATITVTAGSRAATASSQSTSNSSSTVSNSAATSSALVAGTEATSSVASTSAEAQAAAAAAAGGFGTWWQWPLIVLGLLIVIGVAWYSLRRKN